MGVVEWYLCEPTNIQVFRTNSSYGRWDEARALYRWSQPLMKLDTHVHFVQYIKLLCQETGLAQEWVREPRLPISGAERESVLKIIRTALAQRP